MVGCVDDPPPVEQNQTGRGIDCTIADACFRARAAVHLIGDCRTHVEQAPARAEMRHGVAARGHGLRLNRGRVGGGRRADLERDDALQIVVHVKAVDDDQAVARCRDHELAAIAPTIEADLSVGIGGARDDGALARAYGPRVLAHRADGRAVALDNPSLTRLRQRYRSASVLRHDLPRAG